jgi:hypothetical protein
MECKLGSLRDLSGWKPELLGRRMQDVRHRHFACSLSARHLWVVGMRKLGILLDLSGWKPDLFSAHRSEEIANGKRHSILITSGTTVAENEKRRQAAALQSASREILILVIRA